MCCMISMISEQSTSRIRQTEAASHNRFPGETTAGAGQQASGDHANTSWPHTHIVTRDLCSRYCVLKVGGVKNVQVDGSVLQSKRGKLFCHHFHWKLKLFNSYETVVFSRITALQSQ